ncbi:MAG: sterol desaturase family protein [Myxococcales bacterium]|nr:sterol desaturase family protein [Myxococcales bacterium]MCB9752367.1 sterol desaturase family protein [Myxococcales bacterium]
MPRVIVLLCALLVAVAIVVELALRPGARGRELLTNLGLGGARVLARPWLWGLEALIYVGVAELCARWSGLAPLDPGRATTWLIALLGYDFLYYWAHRASHRAGLLWAIHEVHHQPTRYDVTVGLRVSLLNSASLLPFFLPLAALGVPLEVYAGVAVAHYLAMAWLHVDTPAPARRSPGRARGILRAAARAVFFALVNTPALHRVHHSRAARHVDKNFGGVLIVWDRVFGTYIGPEPVLATGVHGRDAAPGILGAHLVPALALWRRLQRRERAWRKLVVLLLG